MPAWPSLVQVRGSRLPEGKDSGVVLLRPRTVPIGRLALVWVLVIDLPDHIGLGRFSAGAALTVFTALVCLGTLIAKVAAPSIPRKTVEPVLTSNARRVPLVLLLFAFWATASALLHASAAGAQNVLVYDTFVGVVLVCSFSTSAGTANRFLRQMNRATWLVAAIYLVTVARDGFGASAIYGPRSVALAGLLLVAVAISRRQRLLAVMVLVVIGASLSRTATVVAITLFCLGIPLSRRLQRPRLGRIAAWSVAGAVTAGLAVTKIAPLRDRFLGGDNAFVYHGINFNTAGRSQLWSYTWRIAHEHLLFGGGPGDAQNRVTAHFAGEINHPHNDYLRLLNDLGVIGLGLFLISILALLHGTWVRGSRTGDPVHWAAFLGVAGVACAAITDNALVYPFVMVPLGVVVGLSLAHPIGDQVPAAQRSGDHGSAWFH